MNDLKNKKESKTFSTKDNLFTGGLIFIIFGGTLCVILTLILNIINRGGLMNILSSIFALVVIFMLLLIIKIT